MSFKKFSTKTNLRYFEMFCIPSIPGKSREKSSATNVKKQFAQPNEKVARKPRYKILSVLKIFFLNLQYDRLVGIFF